MSQSELLFELGSKAILPFWLAMILAPKSRLTRRLMSSGPWVCATLAVAYALLVLPNLASLLPILAKPELQAIQQLLSTPLGAAAGWLHFLAFDLFVGRYIWESVLDQQRSTLLLRPVLLLTLMFGPLGLLVFMLWTRFPWGRLTGSRALLTLSWLMVGLVGLSLIGLALDHRTVTSLPVWIKPLKFSLSVMIYCVTLDLILRRIGHVRQANLVRSVIAACLLLEMVIITTQAVRGTTSHFNTSTAFDQALWATMGVAILLVWLVAMLVTYLLWRDRTLDPVLAIALRWGALISVIGMGWAWPMTALGAHTVGAPDGGPGVPLLGWSTIAGDLRVPHFLGLHGLQIMPMLWLIGPRRQAVMHLHGACLTALTCYLGVQAMEGFTVFRFDPVLMVLLTGWAATVFFGFRESGPTPNPHKVTEQD